MKLENYILICSYEYSHNKDRLWRKTRSNHLNTRCIGVDPNRNWGYNWGGQGASGDPCDETYYGPKPFSEPETAAIRNFIMARKDSMQVKKYTYTISIYRSGRGSLIENRKCGNFRIFLPLRFYVKSILVI